jgi:hypothetical protein
LELFSKNNKVKIEKKSKKKRETNQKMETDRGNQSGPAAEAAHGPSGRNPEGVRRPPFPSLTT